MSLLGGGSYFTTKATKTKLPLAGVDSKQAVAFTLTASDSWDPDSFVLPPQQVDGSEIDFTEKVRSTFLMSGISGKNSNMPQQLDLKGFANFTNRQSRPAPDSALSPEEEFALILRLLKAVQKKDTRCLSKVVPQLPKDIEEAHQAYSSETIQITTVARISSLCAFIFLVIVTAHLFYTGGMSTLTMVFAILCPCTTLFGFIGARPRVRSPVLDTVATFLPWLMALLLLTASDIKQHFVLVDPVLFRTFSALHILSLGNRHPLLRIVICDIVFNCVPILVVTTSYYNNAAAAEELVFSSVIVVVVTLFSYSNLVARLNNAKRMSAHRWIHSKILRATELECAVYTALSKVVFPAYFAEDLMKWYLTGCKPEEAVTHRYNQLVVFAGTVSVRTVSLDDPTTAVGKLNELETRIYDALQGSSNLLRLSTNGDVIMLAGPIDFAGEASIEEDESPKSPKANASGSGSSPSSGSRNLRSGLDIGALLSQGEAELDAAVERSVAFAHALHEYGKANGITITFVGQICCNATGVVMGSQRAAYTIVGGDVSLTRNLAYSASETGVFATLRLAQSFNRINEQSINPMRPSGGELRHPMLFQAPRKWKVTSDGSAAPLQIEVLPLVSSR